MPLLLQRLRSGLVELRTDDGLLYARPSLWERLYLLWTFRNFHRLPQQVLNRRQRQLIEKLCRTSVVALKGPIARTALIGAVENLDAVLQSKAQTAATGKLVTMAPLSTPIAKAAGSEKIPISRNRTTVGPTRLTRFREKSRSNEEQSQSNKRQPSRFPSLIPGNWRTRNWMAAGLVLGGGVVLLTMFSYVSKKHVAIPNPAPSVAAAHNPSSPTPLPPRVANPDKIEAPSAIPPPRTATGKTLQPLPRTAPLVNGSDSFAKTVVPTALLSAAQTNSVQRPYIAESPQNSFNYPIAPISNLSGSVTLRAVVGIDGTVTSVDVLSGNPLLAKAAVQAVRHWRYASRKMNGNAVEMETNIVINFLGEDAVSISFPAAESAERPSVGVTQNTERR